MLSLLSKAENIFLQLEARLLSGLFGVHHPTPALAGLPSVHDWDSHGLDEPYSFKDDGFLFAVPKSRRTIAKRRNRRFGWPEYHWKPLVPKKNLIVCETCGHYHQSGFLCGTCYNKIMKETEDIQKKIEASTGLEPIDKEVVVLYEEEALAKQSDYVNGKRVVEMNKKRPSWFSSNLLQKSTSKETSTKDVPPTELA